MKYVRVNSLRPYVLETNNLLLLLTSLCLFSNSSDNLQELYAKTENILKKYPNSFHHLEALNGVIQNIVYPWTVCPKA